MAFLGFQQLGAVRLTLPPDDPPKSEVASHFTKENRQAQSSLAVRSSRASALLYCGARRALCRPTFLRSHGGGRQRVTKPALRSGERLASSYSISARVKPWRDGSGLAGGTAALDGHVDVELVVHVQHVQRLAHDHARGHAAEGFVQRLAVHEDAAAARLVWALPVLRRTGAVIGADSPCACFSR